MFVILRSTQSASLECYLVEECKITSEGKSSCTTGDIGTSNPSLTTTPDTTVAEEDDFQMCLV